MQPIYQENCPTRLVFLNRLWRHVQWNILWKRVKRIIRDSDSFIERLLAYCRRGQRSLWSQAAWQVYPIGFQLR